MTVSTTARLGQTRWSADADPQNRGQFDTSAANLEALAGVLLQSTLATRPAAAPSNARAFHWATDAGLATDARLTYSDGTTWTLLGSTPPTFARSFLLGG